VKTLSWDQLLWLVPFFFALHNLEEAPFMEAWSKRLPLKIHPAVTTRQFAVAVAFLTLAGFIVTYLGVEYLHNSTGYLLVFAIQAILFFNAFIPHIESTIRFRMYSPGVITAVVITIPFSIYLFRRALSEEMLNWKQIWGLLALAPFAMVFFAYVSLQIGNLFDKQASDKSS
jgi:hypothetical protein